MKVLKVKIEGTTPLMMNNPQTVNPFNEYAKQIKKYTSIKKKTDEELMALYKLKFISSLYYRNGMYFLPFSQLWRSLADAAKEFKKCKVFEQSVQVANDMTINFADADKTPEQLWALERYTDIRDAAIQKSRISACRAIFGEWSTEAEIWYDETQLNKEDIERALEIAGIRCGLGTYRKLYGKFRYKEI